MQRLSKESVLGTVGQGTTAGARDLFVVDDVLTIHRRALIGHRRDHTVG